MSLTNKIFILIVSFIVLMWLGQALLNHAGLRDEYVSVSIGGVSVEALIADSPTEFFKGLSGRKGLKKNEGMLFIFPDDGLHQFWMKDMLFPIDIIWINSEKQVVFIKKDARPESFPELFVPSSPARYVLEVSTGFVEKNKINPGDFLTLAL